MSNYSDGNRRKHAKAKSFNNTYRNRDKSEFYTALQQQIRARRETELVLSQQIQRQRLMMEMAQRIRQSLDITDILQTTVDEVRQFLETDRVLLYQFADDFVSGTVVVESVGSEWISILANRFEDPCVATQYADRFRQGEITVKNDIYHENVDPCHIELLASYQVRANLVVPILEGDRLWGLLIAHHCAVPRQWQLLDIDLLCQLAVQVGIAIQQSSLLTHARSEAIERQQAQADLIHKTTELSDLYNNAPCGYHSTDRECKYQSINDTELTMLGYTRAEIVGKKRLFDLLTPECQATFPSKFLLFQQQGRVDDVEFEIIRKDGTRLPVSLNSRAVYDREGNYLMSRSILLDISDRVKVRVERELTVAQLRESEQKVRAIFDGTAHLMGLMTPEGILIEANQTAFKTFSLVRADILDCRRQVFNQRFCWDISWWKDSIDAQSQLQQAIHQAASGRAARFELNHLASEGVPMAIDFSITPICDDAETVVMLILEGRDITAQMTAQRERQQAEAALQQSQQQIISSWESMTDGYVLLDVDWRLIYVNSTAMRMFRSGLNLAPEQILGENHWELFDRTVGTMLEFEYRRAMSEQVAVHFELLSPAGNWLDIHVYPSATGLSIYFHDNTERKQIEQERDRFLAVGSDLQIIANSDGYFRWVSPSFERLLDRTLAEMTSVPWINFVHPKDVDATLAETARIISAGITTFTFENRYRHQDGSYRNLLWKSQVYADEALVYGAAVDITEKKQLETQFLRAQRLESLGTLASGIAHDLNNILTPILAVSQLLPLKLPNIDDRTHSLLHMLEDSAKRGTNLVQQILSFARGSDGTRTSVQIKQTLAEVVDVARQTFPKSIEISLNLDRSDLWPICADVTQLYQVLMNLTINARDAMPNGGHLSIAAGNLVLDKNYARINIDAKVGPYVVVTIADTGTGIAPELLERIFEPFFTTKAPKQGTGLGLSTTLGIIKNHGGFVSIDSDLGQGTWINIYLPAQSNCEPVKSIAGADGKPFDPVALPFGQGELVLVVDDEVSIREITKTSLEAYNYRAIVASNGIEAIALYAQRHSEIRFILLDLMMPALDSKSTIRVLQGIDPHVAIVVMSGMIADRQFKNVGELNVQAFLAKPFTSEQLLQTLDRLRSSVFKL
jgi:PAS domain S-box-containing protein